MYKHQLIPIILSILGAGFLFISILQGEAEVGIAVIFPFIIGSGIFTFLGVLCIFTAIVFVILSVNKTYSQFNLQHNPDHMVDDIENTTNKRRSGGVIFVGPVPIVFISNWKITVLIMVVIIFFFILFSILFLNLF